jgi:hypothetical protein
VKTITHTTPSRDRVLHIETDGAIVNIEVGLSDARGNRVTRVDVMADRTPDADGYMWDHVDSRIVRRAEPGTDATPHGGMLLALSAAEADYLARAVDLGRSDDQARAILAPTERDDLLRKLGGRRTS